MWAVLQRPCQVRFLACAALADRIANSDTSDERGNSSVRCVRVFKEFAMPGLKSMECAELVVCRGSFASLAEV